MNVLDNVKSCFDQSVDCSIVTWNPRKEIGLLNYNVKSSKINFQLTLQMGESRRARYKWWLLLPKHQLLARSCENIARKICIRKKKKKKKHFLLWFNTFRTERYKTRQIKKPYLMAYKTHPWFWRMKWLKKLSLKF